ncbi:hypothetical protein A1O7_07234 [Cladophialophora yegresii CBS 114405]|uniref:Uncharacterized protein n=1 Tax=Cladophialophora yegresii CBS 114405 TaxID=1182544 RepID=W9VW35_9EURO|nr:uncharacterized protein A1O7_07234 [Cladophialophora yegresii CBS 114405]EXJ56890.1 hypothetical protein A1O7_07234 [Cladophialophora yegresii CBS 114405]
MSPAQSHQPSEVMISHQHPDASPPSNHTTIIAWYLSLHTCLLIALVAIKLGSLWWSVSDGVKGPSHTNKASPDKPSGALNAVQPSSRAPKVLLAWEASDPVLCKGVVQGRGPCHRGHLRLELDFDEVQTCESTRTRTRSESETTPQPRQGPEPSSEPTSVHQSRKSDVRSLHFGVAPRLVPVQELDGDNVLMPCSKEISKRNARLRGGTGSRRTPDTKANSKTDAGVDRGMGTESYPPTAETDPETDTARNNDSSPSANTNIHMIQHDNHDNDNHTHHMTAYLRLEDHIEEVLRDFDELERHRTGSLLRDALTHNECARLIALYRHLERRLEEHMRALGVEVEVDPSEMQLDGNEHRDQAPRENEDDVLRRTWESL